jgi:cytoskeletal protein CcmA (bactofilin family)
MLRLTLFIALFISLPGIAWGSSVIRTGEAISVASDQAVEGDFYGVANDIIVSGEVASDFIVAGVNLTVNGKVGADLSALASLVDIYGTVGDDARIVASDVTIAGEVLGDLVVVAGSLKVLSTAKITGDIIFYGTQADINGEVGKSILGTMEKVRIDGAVGGDIDIKTSGLVLGDRADVVGMVRYTSANELVRSPNAMVAGKVVKNDPVVAEVNSLKEILVPVLIMLFTALVWFLFLRRLLDKVVAQTNDYSLRSMLIGFGLFFLVPIAVLILIMSTLGSLLGLTLLFIYFVLISASVAISGVVTGSYLAKLVSKSSAVTIPFILLGTAVTIAVCFIPVLGPVAFMGLLFVTLGALTTHLYRLVRVS